MACLIPPMPPFIVNAVACSTVTGASNGSTELMTSLNQLNPSLGRFIASTRSLHQLVSPSLCFRACVSHLPQCCSTISDQTNRILQFSDGVKILVCVPVRALCGWVLDMLQSVITTNYSIIITETYSLYNQPGVCFLYNNVTCC